jgi:hypothetical protein
MHVERARQTPPAGARNAAHDQSNYLNTQLAPAWPFDVRESCAMLSESSIFAAF